MGQPQIVEALGHVVRELVAEGVADAPELAIFVALFLASAESQAIIGQELALDAGWG